MNPGRGGGGRGRGDGRGRHGHDGPFRRGGFRRTAPRDAILNVVREAAAYMSAEEVYMEVYKRLPGIGIATVYRTLQLLSELGVVSRVSTDEGKARYRFAEEEVPAHRVVVICRRCSRTRSVRVDSEEVQSRLGSFREAIEKSGRFTAEQSLHQFYGVCSECAQAAEL